MKLSYHPNICLFCFALLTGCKTIGDSFQRPNILQGSRDQWKNASLATKIPAQGEWWKSFQDSKLNSLIQQALSSNQDLKKAASKINQANAQIQQFEADLYPEINSNSSYTSSQSNSNNNNRSISLSRRNYRSVFNLNHEIDLWGKIQRSIESSKNQSDAVKVAQENVKLRLVANLAKQYFILRNLDEDIRIIQKNINLRSKSLQITQDRLDIGTASARDISRLKTELYNTKNSLVDSQRRRKLVENSIAVLCGQAPQSFHIPEGKIIKTLPKVATGIPSQLLLRRADVVEAELIAASKMAEIGVAKAAFLPSIQLTIEGGFQSPEFSNVFAWDQRNWAFGPRISIPIFSGKKNKANLAIAEEKYQQAVADYKNLALLAFQDVEDALININQYQMQQSHLQKALESAKFTAENDLNLLNTGAAQYLDIVDSQRSLLDAERNYSNNQGLQAQATIDLIQALGGAW